MSKAEVFNFSSGLWRFAHKGSITNIYNLKVVLFLKTVTYLHTFHFGGSASYFRRNAYSSLQKCLAHPFNHLTLCWLLSEVVDRESRPETYGGCQHFPHPNFSCFLQFHAPCTINLLYLQLICTFFYSVCN